MNKIAAYAIFISRFSSKNFKSVTIKTVKSILGAEPKKPLFILYATDGGIIR